MSEVLQYTAFSDRPSGGNPAGIVLDAAALSDEEMLAIAADLGHSESAFVTGADRERRRVRYFTPVAEIPFCGHATIAAAVAIAEREPVDRLVFETGAGPVDIAVARAESILATLTSVPPAITQLPDDDLDALLRTLGYERADLDGRMPPRVAYAGAVHPIIALLRRERLAELAYDFDALRTLMDDRGWTTIDLVFRRSASTFDVRNPFPPGGIVEDPATGAAAAALGAYLRELGLVAPPAELTIHQGDDLGRPSVLKVSVPAGDGGIAVTGTATRFDKASR